MATKQHAPATLRNREPILAVLKQWLPPQGLVLEIASGTGEHAAYFAANLPGREWQPSDAEPAALDSIAAWRDEVGSANLRPPVRLDVRDGSWPVERAEAMFCANMIHIAPWECALGLMAGAGRVLTAGGVLVLYGPFKVNGHVAPSNLAFDADLKARNPLWGVRDLEAVGAPRPPGSTMWTPSRCLPTICAWCGAGDIDICNRYSYVIVMSKNCRFAVAVHVTSVLALNDEAPCTSEWIAGSVNTNPVVIRRILSALAKAGLVTSIRGSAGGSVLARRPEAITLLEIARAVDEDDGPALHHQPPNPACTVGRGIQPVLVEIIGRAEAAREAVLAQTTLSDVIGAIRVEAG